MVDKETLSTLRLSVRGCFLKKLDENGVGSSVVSLPGGVGPLLIDALCQKFAQIPAEVWLGRFARGRVWGDDGSLLTPDLPAREGLRVHYFREIPAEQPIPFAAQLLHVDEHIAVADKPHFLPVLPAGEYVVQTLLSRLALQLDNPHLVPLHRIDRPTAGLVLFSTNPVSRGRYQALFRERAIHKQYEAVARPLAGCAFPLWRCTRMVEGEPFFRMQEVEGAANSETRVEVLERGDAWWRYALFPVSGKRHQLRLHMAALGAPLKNDTFYPELAANYRREEDDYDRPLQLLARSLRFADPLTGMEREFVSRLRLDAL